MTAEPASPPPQAPNPVGPLPPAGDLATASPARTNLQPAPCNFQPGPTPEVTPVAPQPPTLDFRPQTLDFKPRRRPGPPSKIAQLSAEHRALVNQLLDQDKSYDEVVQELAKHDVSLNVDNVSKWFTGPYQEYLAALDWRDELQKLRDHAFSFGQDEGNVRFQEGLVQIALTQIFRAMKEDRFKDEPSNALRLFNSLARLSREALVIRKYVDQQAKEKVQELRKLDPNRKINEIEETAMQDRSDDFFGWKSADRIKREMAIASQVRTDSTPSPSEPDCRRRGNESLINREPSATEAPSAAEPATFNPQPVTSAPPAPVGPLPPAGESSSATPALTSVQPATSPAPTHESNNPTIHPSTAPTPDPSNRDFPLACGFCPNGPTRLGADFKHCCKDPAPESSRPDPSATQPAPAPLPTPHFTLCIERCHYCHTELPALRSDGQRPFTHCQNCGTALRPPETRHLYCPACDTNLRDLVVGDRRTSSTCPWCAAPLPPWPAPVATNDKPLATDRAPRNTEN